MYNVWPPIKTKYSKIQNQVAENQECFPHKIRMSVLTTPIKQCDSELSLNLICKFCDFEQTKVYQNQLYHRLTDTNKI